MSRKRCIFLNDNVVSHATQRGIARYFRYVTDGVIAHFGRDAIICSPEARDYSPAKHIPSPRFRGSRRIGLHDKLVSVAAYLEQPSVIFSSYYGTAQTKATEVFTAYDLIPELFPNCFPPNQVDIHRFVAQKRRCFERASVLIAISKNTANDIVAFYPQLNTDIQVIYPGVDDFFFEGDNQHVDREERPFFLYVGHRTLYKNFLRLLIAFGESGLANDFCLKVISPSGDDFTPQELECIRKYHLEDSVHLLIAVTESVLRANYRQAVALVYPSEYEGFGLPVLEAMASGTLVAASNVSSLPEVGGDVALYFDPYDTESMADCLTRLVNLSSKERSERIARGISHARTFTWENCQRQTIDVLKGLA